MTRGEIMELMEVKQFDKDELQNYVVSTITRYYSFDKLSIDYVGGGSYGRAYRVEMDCEPYTLIAKVYLVAEMCAKDAVALKVLRDHCRIRFPKVYFQREADENVPVDIMLMEYIEGKDVFSDYRLLFKSRKQRDKFASNVVDAMADIHSFTNVKFGDLENPTFDNWLDYYRPFAEDVLISAREMNKKGQLPNSILIVMEDAWEKFDLIFDKKVVEASLIHGDLNVMNIMVKKPFEISGFIDPLNAMFADKEYDLFQLNNLTGKRFGLYYKYKEKYPVSQNCDVKCAFYALWNEVHCYITSGKLFKLIMKPIAKNMKRQLQLLK